MGNLKRDYNRFVYKHRNKGIPNLMMWICLSNALIFVLWYFFNMDFPSLFFFDPFKIMQGEVWRLFSYIFTFACEGNFLGSALLGGIISIVFYLWVGRTLEGTWGTLRFNIFYLSGILLQDLYAMLVFWIFGRAVSFTSHYLNLAMFLSVATLIPDQKVLIYFIIPVKMKWLAWLDLGLTAVIVSIGLFSTVVLAINNAGAYIVAGYFFSVLFPLIALLNYALFFGRDIAAVLPDWMKRKRRKTAKNINFSNTRPAPNPDWAKNYRSSSGEKPYRHRCTVCGRTDTSCPDLEFRYCSKCKGYFCYCIEHINNHSHVQ